VKLSAVAQTAGMRSRTIVAAGSEHAKYFLGELIGTG
jgi:hypothetical protein